MAAGGSGGGSGAGASVDLDLAAVENIPRDTLVALLKRKDKEAKSAIAKLDKLEERYVKVVRFNKLLMEDRTSFQRFCSDLLPESDGVFEEAAAQETPVNLDALLRRLQAWRSTFEAVSEDRKVFQQFVELVFPADEGLAQLFRDPSLGAGAFDTLQHRWMAREDLHNQSMASINSMAREQMTERGRELEDAKVARAEAERRLEEMREQMTQLARDKAQSLKLRLSGGDARSPSPEAAPAGDHGGSSAQLQGLTEQLARSERREREAREAADKRESDLQSSLDQQEAEARRLRKELDTLREEGERQARQLAAEKDSATERLQRRLEELEEELGSNDFIVRAAEQQAGRDVEVKQQRRELDQLQGTVADIQRQLTMSYTQERVLKDRIRELEQSHGRGHVAGDYLKHVILKYVRYNQSGDLKAHTLVPVLAELLKLGAEERKALEAGPAVPHTLLALNQAVGGAAMWMRGVPSADASASTAAAPDLSG